MSIDAETLFALLPAIHRLRDAETAAIGPLLTATEAAELAALAALPAATVAEQERLAGLQALAARGPLQALLEVFADEIAVVEENLAQLYDDLFIETCADWVVPYIGDLIGYEPLHCPGPAQGADQVNARAEVAHTIALRRRKGTATALEQIAVDVTGWGARVVEYFELLSATQYLNHPRPHCLATADLRQGAVLAERGGAFEGLRHTLDVRRVDAVGRAGQGRFNIPNIGIFLWRLGAFRRTRSPALRVDDQRWLISPLGHPLPLFTKPRAEDEITHLAEPINVPAPLGRRRLAAALADYVGYAAGPGAPTDNADPSLVLYLDGAEIPRAEISVCNLADGPAGWAHQPAPGRVAIDPVLGRIALAADRPVPARVEVTFHEGFAAALGGGEYPRPQAADPTGAQIIRVPADHATIQAGLDALAAIALAPPPNAAPFGVLEIGDSGRYSEAIAIAITAGWSLTLRAAAGCRPVLHLTGDLPITGGVASHCTLDGLLITAGRLVVPAVANDLAALTLRHTTLVPGLALDGAGAPVSPDAPSLICARDGAEVALDHVISGALHVAAGASLRANDSIIDATAAGRTAFTGADGLAAGGTLSLDACTLIGQVSAVAVGLISNSLLLARATAGDSRPPVRVQRRQTGCVRYCYLPVAAAVPRPHRCQPGLAEGASATPAPRFTSRRYGTPGYCQLTPDTPEAIRAGADDEGEMGAFHVLFPVQREANLRLRLQEFLRAGLAAGIFYAT